MTAIIAAKQKATVGELANVAGRYIKADTGPYMLAIRKPSLGLLYKVWPCLSAKVGISLQEFIFQKGARKTKYKKLVNRKKEATVSI